MGFMSLVAVYAPTEMCEGNKEMFYAKLNTVLDQYTGTHSLSWVTSMLPLALRELATSYVLVPMALVPGTPIALSF